MSRELEIPSGIYCHSSNGLCPYWSIDKKHKEQNNGYCSYLKKGDWELRGGLLWDQVKECGINDLSEEDIVMVEQLIDSKEYKFSDDFL